MKLVKVNYSGIKIQKVEAKKAQYFNTNAQKQINLLPRSYCTLLCRFSLYSIENGWCLCIIDFCIINGTLMANVIKPTLLFGKMTEEDVSDFGPG